MCNSPNVINDDNIISFKVYFVKLVTKWKPVRKKVQDLHICSFETKKTSILFICKIKMERPYGRTKNKQKDDRMRVLPSFDVGPKDRTKRIPLWVLQYSASLWYLRI